MFIYYWTLSSQEHVKSMFLYYVTHIIVGMGSRISSSKIKWKSCFLHYILGGFLAQKFAESTVNCPRVASLVLCNTFTDTSVFSYSDSAAM